MQKVGESVGVSEEMDKQMLVIQVFQMFEAVDFSILGNCHQWTKSDRLNREYDTAILDILRKPLLPQSNQFTEPVRVLKSVGDHPALLRKPRLEKTFFRERKRLANEVEHGRGNGMYLLCRDESFDGIAASIRMTIVISENIKVNSLGRRLGTILGGRLVQLICELSGERPDCFLGS
jgi:hypothetical protein